MRSSRAHRSGAGEEGWRDTRRCAVARHLAKRIGEELGEEGWRGKREGETEGVLTKFSTSNPYLAGGEKSIALYRSINQWNNLEQLGISSEDPQTLENPRQKFGRYAYQKNYFRWHSAP